MHPFEDLDVPAGHVGIHWFGQSSLGLKHPMARSFRWTPTTHANARRIGSSTRVHP